jgi:hypothetical protein
MQMQVIFHPEFERDPEGPFQNPDGSRWNLVKYGSERYDAQFKQGFVSDNYALVRWDTPGLNGDAWGVCHLTGESVSGSLGFIPMALARDGISTWAVSGQKFAELTGEHIPDTWQALAAQVTGGALGDAGYADEGSALAPAMYASEMAF